MSKFDFKIRIWDCLDIQHILMCCPCQVLFPHVATSWFQFRLTSWITELLCKPNACNNLCLHGSTVCVNSKRQYYTETKLKKDLSIFKESFYFEGLSYMLYTIYSYVWIWFSLFVEFGFSKKRSFERSSEASYQDFFFFFWRLLTGLCSCWFYFALLNIE